jgi:hypothetical protein
MDAPVIVPHTLVEYMNHFSDLRHSAHRDGEPSPELLAARFCLTGITADDTFLAGINTRRDLLTGSQRNPFVRRDLDSVLGYSRDIPVLDSIHYFPYPNPLRTLESRVHVTHSAKVDHQVSI